MVYRSSNFLTDKYGTVLYSTWFIISASCRLNTGNCQLGSSLALSTSDLLRDMFGVSSRGKSKDSDPVKPFCYPKMSDAETEHPT